MSKPLIFITNDDGIHAPGLRTLIGVMKQLGDLLVVAPDKPMSGMGHAVTITSPLRVNKLKDEPGHIEYSCNGTPADCVKLGQKAILGRNPDLIVSGINHGSNSSVNVIYSGTMAAVLEGAMENIPSIGFSLNDYSFHADFSKCEPYILSIAGNVLEKGLPAYTCLNVNIPAANGSPIKGIKIVRQAMAFWDEKFEHRKDPHERDYFWLTGVFRNRDEGVDTDEWALKNNYVSVVPVHFDLTSHKTIPLLRDWETGNLN
ncbi:5'-nucleotidase SurE [bioreactor metagenome]|jgi:5'-nucleotidase|uniref:5'-nucleotidase n=1 Tax=bioreactor metagenome TaxID=1076179 RepID=A0A644UF82_9ZZZZ|nr:5'/3'-nucleotidase SurE [Lentimicrobium sp.]MEA5111053.1 5'/3'-nucleotidase SurE [Lentimicrobium sp.]HCT71192.1 5'/3'-nucleotidase SurE [Bacteroidales bacterium]